jgi:hypothetical protein
MRDYEAKLLKKIEARSIPNKMPQWQEIFMRNGSKLTFAGGSEDKLRGSKSLLLKYLDALVP